MPDQTMPRVYVMRRRDRTYLSIDQGTKNGNVADLELYGQGKNLSTIYILMLQTSPSKLRDGNEIPVLGFGTYAKILQVGIIWLTK
jgi:hypothetical protein